MLELHTWFTVRETYSVTDEDENIHSIVDKINQKIAENEWIQSKVKVLNAQWHFEVSLFSNHKNSQVSDIFELFDFVSEIAPGSYGMIYMFDDEDKNQQWNEFQVFILARGEIKKYKDHFLSPVVPIIEDPSTSC